MELSVERNIEVAQSASLSRCPAGSGLKNANFVIGETPSAQRLVFEIPWRYLKIISQSAPALYLESTALKIAVKR